MPSEAGVSSVAPPAMPALPKPDDPNAKGKFNAGGQLRFPSGPDETGKYATFNWIALDVKGRYNPTRWLAMYLNAPIALKHPDLPAPMESPSIFGGVTARTELGLGKKFGFFMTLGAMRDRALFYSEKMYPYYYGSMEGIFATGFYLHFKFLGLHIDTSPGVAYQNGTGNGTAVQLPLSAMLKLGSLLEVAADTGIYTAPGLSFDADKGAQIYLGGSVTVKIKPIVLHVGAGVASLLTGTPGMAAYSSIGQSVYFDVNAKYAR